MKINITKSTIKITIAMILFLTGSIYAARYMENLGRGVVAVRTGSGAFVSWRLLGTDPTGIGFNLYRSTGGGAAVKLNGSVLTDETCYTDTTGNFTQDNTYYVKPVIDDTEQAASGSFTLTANHAAEPRVVVPLSGGNTDIIHFVWVGDLDGDGEYDFVVDRLNGEARPQALEAYHRSGTLLWSMDLGPNSTNTYNIEPGSSTIDVGHWDGVTVYDLDSDGKAEVAIRTANGVTFGDGSQLVNSNDNIQFISVVDGLTGAERARIQIPTDYIADGPLAAQMGIGYLNGIAPSIVASMKNRIGSGAFNMMICAWDFDGSSLAQKWKWLRGSQNCPDGHNIRIVDVDDDGMDEVGHIGFVLDNDGTLLYNLGDSGVVHGDRWHIGKFDQNRAGLQGYGIQQDNPSGLREYYYDAGTGEILWTYVGDVGDMGRGDAGDIDPRYSGFECWSFDGVWNGPSGTQITAPGVEPWPVLRLWWDGDDLSESYNDGKIEEWDYINSWVTRLVTTWHYDTYTRSDRGCPMFYGDIFGDWREEVIMTNADYTALGIFTTDIPTTRRIYTLPHNPEYRSCMTVKGYMQSHHMDFYLGDGMATPPQPDIVLVGANNTPALVNHWPLDESEGLTAPDIAGDTDGTLIGGPIWEPNDGAINGALAFDGEDDYVDLDTYTDLGGASAFTICFWVNPAQLPFGGHEGIIGIGTSSQRAPWIWGNYNSHNLRMQFETTTGGISDGDLQIGEMAEDTWTHVAVTWDGSTCSSYINGELDNTDDTTGNIMVVSDGTNYLGHIAGYGYWHGSLDDILIYNYELSSAEIGTLYLLSRPTDLDEDGDVDFVDLYMFSGQYLQPPEQIADFNNDGSVNLVDYAELTIDWLVGVE